MLEDLTNDMGYKERIKAYVFEIKKPKWWDIRSWFKSKGAVDYTISTEHFKLTWLAGDKYSLIIRVHSNPIVTNAEPEVVKKTSDKKW